jgi:dUTP pyrophosphatase
MLFYLASPIDRANMQIRFTVRQVANDLINELAISEHTVFNPASGFSVGSSAKPNRTIETINQVAQEQADGLIVIWPEGAKSWGVPVEVERAIRRNQPVVFLWDRDAISWAMPQAWSDSDLIESFSLDDSISIGHAVDWLEQTIADHKKTTAGNGIPVKLLGDGAKVPTRAYSDDAGFDLYVSEDRSVAPGEFVDIPCAVAVELPPHTWALLTGRSSTLRKKRLLVNQGVIDPGYRGELFAGVWNLSAEPVEVKAGERVAQLIPMHNQALTFDLFEVEQLASHPRGEQGFGSSGQ